jgi:hypothetical protein
MSIEAVLTVQLNRKSQNGMAVCLCKIRLIIEWEQGASIPALLRGLLAFQPDRKRQL